ncbi:hypothetical protein BGZ98_009865 [Dissophora globulifera]|nr:hypothetical protein BGZ98_009865 [Dissophora globulifera]
MDKRRPPARRNTKVLRIAASYETLESDSVKPQPHHPSAVYSPNPFPLDPAQPDGVSRHVFQAHRERETREVDTIDIEIEETKGFVSGKSRRSIDSDRGGAAVDTDYSARKPNTMQKLGAGFKGALAKSGLTKSKEKDSGKEPAVVDAVLQHHLEQQRKQQQQRQQQEVEIAGQSALPRGREREVKRIVSGPLYPDRMGQGQGSAMSSETLRDNRDPFSERRQRLHSLSPPPPPGQDRRNSSSYWPEDRRAIHAEQSRPFIEYQPPPPVSSGRNVYRQQRHGHARPQGVVSDSEYGEYARQSRDVRYSSRERRESDRMRREALGGGVGGARRQSGLNRVTNVDSAPRTSSEFGDDEDTSSAGVTGNRLDQQDMPDRLSRAKEWVASHSKNNSVTVSAPIMDREAVLAALPGAFPSRSGYRRSMDVEEYGMLPPRGSHIVSTAERYEEHDRMLMMNQAQMQGPQRAHRDSMGDDGRYWSRQLEGYEHEQYNQRRTDYEYNSPGGFYGYARGGPDDPDDEESTLAPGSAVGEANQKHKVLDGFADANKAKTPDAVAAEDDMDDSQLAALGRPNKRRLILRLVSLAASILTLVLLIAAAPVSHASSPFSSQVGLAFHYVVAVLSAVASAVFVFNYFSRRMRRKQKMKRYILIGLDVFMTLALLIDVFVCISKFPCAVGGQNGWCDMYNSSVFLAMVAFGCFFAAILWDIWGSINHSKLFGGRALIKPPPPGFAAYDKRGGKMPGQRMPGYMPGQMSGQMPGQMPGQVPGQMPGQMPGQVPEMWV